MKSAIIAGVRSGCQRPTRTRCRRLVAQQLGHSTGGSINTRQTGFQVEDETRGSPGSIERAPIGTPYHTILNGRLDWQGCPSRQGVDEPDPRPTLCRAIDQ